MKNVVRDNSAYQNALKRQQEANSNLSYARESEQNIKYNEQMADLAQQAIDTQRSYNAVNTVLQVADLALNYGSKIYDVVQQSQATQANNDLSLSLQEGQRILQSSIANGTTYFGTNATTGEAELVMAPEVENWYNSSREKISNGKYMTSVRESALQSFDLSYEALKTNANSNLIEKYYSDLNTNFSTSLDIAKQADIQSYVQAGGDIDAWNATSTIQGIKAINSRTDWSDDAKSAQTTSYLLEVQKEGDTQIAANLAKTQGLQQALDFIDGKGQYTTAEKQKMFASASTAATYAKTAAIESAEGYMEDALVNSTATPEQVYKALEEQYATSSPAIQASAKEAATLKQTEIVQSMVSNTLATDKQKGISTVYETLKSINSGAWDDKFYGIDSVKNSAISSYTSTISDYEEQIAKDTASQIKTIDDSNKTAFTVYQQQQENNLANYDSGAITGAQFITNELTYADELSKSLKEGGTYNTTYWTDQTSALANAAIEKISGLYVPKKYQSAVDDACDYIKIAMGNNVTSSKMTDEIADSIYKNNLEFTGRVADYIRENGATMTDEEFSSWVRDEATNYVLLQKNKAYKLINEGNAVYDETSMKDKNSEFKKVIEMAYSEGSANSYLVSLGYDFSTGQPRYTFKNDEAEKTFSDMSTVAKTQIWWLTGANETDIEVVLDNSSGNGVAFAPLVTVADGNGKSYKFDGKGNIYENVNGKKDADGRTIWTDTGLDMATSAEDMERQKKKLNTLSVGSNITTPDNGNSTSSVVSEVRDFAENKKTVTLREISDFLKTSDDINASANELEKLYESGELECDFNKSNSSMTFRQHLNGIISALTQLRLKGKV